MGIEQEVEKEIKIVNANTYVSNALTKPTFNQYYG